MPKHNTLKRAKPRRHKLTHTIEYQSWGHMRGRCNNPNNDCYHRYGGAGVTVCERWDSFELFLLDMGPRPSTKYTLDRWPNPNGNYEPGNCRWATVSEQNTNYRKSNLIEYNNETMTLLELVRRSGSIIQINTIRDRLASGWPIEKALHKPTRKAYICINRHQVTVILTNGRRANLDRFTCPLCKTELLDNWKLYKQAEINHQLVQQQKT